tara:strand:+ start:24869 stop:25369 length:501 start_codon:yes stop_codon:yes gene_type:complete
MKCDHCEYIAKPGELTIKMPSGAMLCETCYGPEKGQGMKFDTDKPRTGLMISGFSRALTEVAKVTTFGAKKYAPDNWRKVENGIERYRDAAYRHMLASAHQKNDEESGLPHLAHAAWCLLAMMELGGCKRRDFEADKKLADENMAWFKEYLKKVDDFGRPLRERDR